VINDCQTNTVYVSSLLKTRKQFAPVFKRLTETLDELRVPWNVLEGTNDIWARDYMPVQVSKTHFVQFDYHPSYLMNSAYWRKTITDGAAVVRRLGIEPELSNIKLDGGNLVHFDGKVIITDRVVRENPQYEKKALLKELKRLLEVDEIILIREEPGDEFGHADGMAWFSLRNDLVFINEYPPGMRNIEKQVTEDIEKHGIKVLRFFPVNQHMVGAGVPINFLQVGKWALYPVFGLKTDDATRRTFKTLFGPFGRPIRANELAREGGLLHCATWNILR